MYKLWKLLFFHFSTLWNTQIHFKKLTFKGRTTAFIPHLKSLFFPGKKLPHFFFLLQTRTKRLKSGHVPVRTIPVRRTFLPNGTRLRILSVSKVTGQGHFKFTLKVTLIYQSRIQHFLFGDVKPWGWGAQNIKTGYFLK